MVHHLIRQSLIAVVIAAQCVVPARARPDGQEAPRFRAGVALVPITAVVRDSRGRFVRDLVREDFEVVEKNEPRAIVDFRSADNAAISVAVLLDTSGSMRDGNLETAKSVVTALVAALEPSSDEAALFTFDKVLREETPFTNDVAIIQRALDKTFAWGLTALYDAIGGTAKKVGNRQAQRRAVIVVTDGVDTGSTITSVDASGLASAVDVPVYVLTVAPPKRRLFGADDTLANLARWTGGDHVPVHQTEQRQRAIVGFVAELRQLYFMAIESAATPGWYPLEVKTKRKNLTVRARRGYFAAQ